MMSRIPETRASLIVRLPNADDAPAWTEFAETYEPFVYQFARRRGLQDSDARELVQEVFLGVAKAVRRWEPDEKRARFRTWLFRIARNQLCTQLTARQREHVVDSDAWDHLEGALGEDEARSVSETEYRREVFRWASRKCSVRSNRRPGPRSGKPVLWDGQLTTWPNSWESLEASCTSPAVA